MSKIDPKDDFSVALGLTDYGNPILYTVTCVTLLLHMGELMPLPWAILWGLGALVSLVFGFTIPTVKLLIGLGKMQFSLPVNLVTYVNSGIFCSGIALMVNMLQLRPLTVLLIALPAALFLGAVYVTTKKFNNVAVLIGAIGYLLIYTAFIFRAVTVGKTLSLLLYCLAVCLYLLLIGIGLKADLKDARVHWVIELTNICCQGSVAAGTLLLFAGK